MRNTSRDLVQRDLVQRDLAQRDLVQRDLAQRVVVTCDVHGSELRPLHPPASEPPPGDAALSSGVSSPRAARGLRLFSRASRLATTIWESFLFFCCFFIRSVRWETSQYQLYNQAQLKVHVTRASGCPLTPQPQGPLSP
ncbi:hypothetical protein EYF80_047818 [Liparis tanakae]|uniref:Uncharacterized protein n=1 Tax=Liparis tanakae TaxID=230148 RepID=A0A4Z2FL84_9TELE|nr:hypothetical protein EYF80_047818 [Liparis tanakae]